MKKFFAMMVMAITVSLSFTSCLTTGSASEWGKVSKLADNGSELRWTMNDVVAEFTYVYGYKGEQITSHKELLKCGSNLVAKATFEDYKDSEDVEASLSGKTITLVYPESEYKDLTVTDVKAMYDEMKKLNDEIWD